MSANVVVAVGLWHGGIVLDISVSSAQVVTGMIMVAGICGTRGGRSGVEAIRLTPHPMRRIKRGTAVRFVVAPARSSGKDGTLEPAGSCRTSTV